MEIIPAFVLALGVSADAFAVAIAHGAAASELRRFEALRVALFFGLFQAVMPILGWLLGQHFHEQIVSFDHWIAFVLLGGIGVKMIFDDFKGADFAGEPAEEENGIWNLLVLSVATSIDAFAVGLGLAFLDSITRPVVLIGIVTFAMSLAGVYLGFRFKHLGHNRSKTIGGMILIGIGTKILIDHLSAG